MNKVEVREMRGRIQLFTLPLDLERAYQYSAMRLSEEAQADPSRPMRDLEVHQAPRF